MTDPRRVAIHYRRPPDGLRIYDQRVVHETDDAIVTISEPLDIESPVVVNGDIVLEAGSLAVWFTFPGVWHDIGRFHRGDGAFTGIYANILTPPLIEGDVWHTTDLWLDVWVGTDGSATLLDEDEFEDGASAGHIDDATAARARQEASSILERYRGGHWPPPIVQHWTLERAQSVLGGS